MGLHSRRAGCFAADTQVHGLCPKELNGGVAILMMAGLGVGTLINKLITKLTSKGGEKIEKIEKEEQKEI
jgi:hypothetical protein